MHLRKHNLIYYKIDTRTGPGYGRTLDSSWEEQNNFVIRQIFSAADFAHFNTRAEQFSKKHKWTF